MTKAGMVELGFEKSVARNQSAARVWVAVVPSSLRRRREPHGPLATGGRKQRQYAQPNDKHSRALRVPVQTSCSFRNGHVELL